MNDIKKPGIILYVKVPKTGFVKTRLVSEFINERQACEIQVTMIKDTLQTLSSLDTKFQPIVSYYPENRLEELKKIIHTFTDNIPDSFIKTIQYIAQEGDTNGAHFASTFSKAFQLQDIDSCIIIGGDTPHLPKKILLDAIEWLTNEEKSALIGPSQNGGFYIYGIRQNIEELETIFSKANEFDNLLKLSSENNLAIKLLPFVFDIDTPEDMKSLFEMNRGIIENKKQIVNKKEITLANHTVEYIAKNLFSNSYF